MDKLRTDLALEAGEILQSGGKFSTDVEGFLQSNHSREGMRVTVTEICTPRAAELLGKPEGRYVTLELPGERGRESAGFPALVRALAAELTPFLDGMPGEGPVLVAGLGNRFITPDALGPGAHRHILVTRHLIGEMPEQFGYLTPVASLAAEVMGNTGMESGEVVRAVCRDIKPRCVIAVDALASRSVERLCRTVQISDTGITPGSGVGNHRFSLNREGLGVPVIAVGVPTVVDAATLAADLTGSDTRPEQGRTLIVTPRDIDKQIADLSRLLGFAVSLALQPSMTVAELELLLS